MLKIPERLLWCIYLLTLNKFYIWLSPQLWAGICWLSFHSGISRDDIYLSEVKNENTKKKCENRSKLTIESPGLMLLCLHRLTWTIFTPCFSVFTANLEQVNPGSYFNTSIKRQSQQKMQLLNANWVNQTHFFQTYFHYSLSQWYPQNFHMIYLCTRHTQPYILNHVFDMNINLYDISDLYDNILIGFNTLHCAKSVRVRSYSGMYFQAFGMNIESISPYSVRMRENMDQNNS